MRLDWQRRRLRRLWMRTRSRRSGCLWPGQVAGRVYDEVGAMGTFHLRLGTASWVPTSRVKERSGKILHFEEALRVSHAHTHCKKA